MTLLDSPRSTTRLPTRLRGFQQSRKRLPWEPTSQPQPQSAKPAESVWDPLPGPQTQALESEADELYYGGGAGGGKSDLLLGYGLTRSRHGIVFRRHFKELEGASGLIARSKEIYGRSDRFNNSALIWRMPDQRIFEFGAVEHDDSKEKWQGRAHDFVGFDEFSHFTESIYLFLCAWARTVVPDQRVRIIACGNPPANAEGEWIIERWAPWLDEAHPNPARPGELRWFVRTRDGDEVEVNGPAPVELLGETLQPKSRTFIPARVQDNPYLMATDYIAQLQQLPEPLRSQLIYGDHNVGLKDQEWQVIPSAWVRAAQARWRPERPADDGGAPLPWQQLGCDIAGGGADQTVVAPRVGDYFGELRITPGHETPDAAASAELIERIMDEEGGVPAVDANGIGAATYHLLRGKKRTATAYLGSAKTTWRDRSLLLTFANVRAAAHWALRDALDPSGPRAVALPPGRNLRVELTATRYTAESRMVKLEDKDDVKKRLNRSPDEGDSVVMANWHLGAGDVLGQVFGGAIPIRRGG